MTRGSAASTTSIAELAERIRPRAGTLLVCTSPNPALQDGSTWVWVFREDARRRLERLWGGTPSRVEADELADHLSRHGTVWRARIDSRHAPPSMRFRLVWTLPPAPCRVYNGRRPALEVAPSVVTIHGSRRPRPVSVSAGDRVEGRIARDWGHAGIALRHAGGGETEILRLKNAGPVTAFLVMYDGIDLLVDTSWLDAVVPRVAGVLGVPWTIVDHTDTPPRTVGVEPPPRSARIP